jgi:organic hydroperoxide reductase OsmC/OhrA
METVQPNQQSTKPPVQFDVQLNWLSEEKGVLSASDVKGVLPVATPPAFGGKGNEWSPEHLLLASVSSCFMSTYLVFVKKFRFEITRFECNVTGVIESTDGKLGFTKIYLFPRVYIASYDFMNAARLALEKAEKYCLISNSLNAAIECKGEVIEEMHPRFSGQQS